MQAVRFQFKSCSKWENIWMYSHLCRCVAGIKLNCKFSLLTDENFSVISIIANTLRAEEDSLPLILILFSLQAISCISSCLFCPWRNEFCTVSSLWASWAAVVPRLCNLHLCAHVDFQETWVLHCGNDSGDWNQNTTWEIKCCFWHELQKQVNLSHHFQSIGFMTIATMLTAEGETMKKVGMRPTRDDKYQAEMTTTWGTISPWRYRKIGISFGGSGLVLNTIIS